MKAVLPVNLDLSVHLTNYPYSKDEFNVFNRDKAHYILSLLTIIPATNELVSSNVEINGGFVPICSKLLQSYVKNYRQYINYFIRTGILETDAKYIPDSLNLGNAKCYGYRFTHDYNNQQSRYIDYSQCFRKKISKRREQEYRKLQKDYKHLTKWLWPVCKLTIQEEKALMYLEKKRDFHLKNPHSRDKRYDKLAHKQRFKDPIAQYNCAKVNVINISLGKVSCIVDETIHRMYTDLTGIKSELRNLITYNKQKLVSIDIKNCQPYLVLYILKNKQTNNPPPGVPIMLDDWRYTFDNEDVKLYSELVSESKNKLDLYMYMQTECIKAGVHIDSRDEVKREVMKIIFSKNGFNSKIKKIFTKAFPTINALFSVIKAKQSNQLSILLQNIESYAVLKIITKRFADKYPNAPLFTIHDSIVTTEPYVDLLRQLMVDQLTKMTGYPPKLKIEEWVQENLNLNMYEAH